MMPEPLPSSRAADLLKEATRELALEELSAPYSPETARWLCLVPAWTPQLATRCELPGWYAGVHVQLLETWRDSGIVESTLTPLSIDDLGQFVAAQRLFWMPRDTRAAWLSRILAEDGRDSVVALMQDVARRILALPRDHHLPSATLKWATLASATASSPSLLHAAFDPELDRALRAERPDEAWLWIEALQRVADVLPGEATMLHQRAVRRLALFDRQRNDRAFLRDYLPRPAQFDAWLELLTGPDDRWALHYLGGGGVGKTMLMRALTSGTPAHFPPGFTAPPVVTARIDFDHIDPRFPARKPGLLFAQLAEELRLKDETGRSVDQFARVFQAIAFLHESEPGAETAQVAVDELIEVFAWACEAIASERGARVVLMLDTCEELARLGPDGRLPESVQRTFELLERLHRRLPSLRVVLCGRRPLAGTYAADERVTPDLPPRPWLRLHRMFPFSEEEARAYLSRAGVASDLVPPILARSAAAGSSASLGLPDDAEDARYSPFSLSVYVTWVTREGSTVTPEAILLDRVDHFVRIRILDRIRNAEVRRLLPHVALLGRFDEATLRACADVRPDVADTVYREIAAQEWIARQAGGYYAVEGELRARLLQYFRQDAPQELQAARRRVLAHVTDAIERAPQTEQLDESLAQALVQLQAHDRAGLLAAWRLLDARIVGTGDVAWGERVLGRVLADDSAGDVEFDGGALGAFLTTYAECVLRRTGPATTAEFWRRAWELTQALEAGEQRAAVLVRIASGGVVQSVVAPDSEAAFDMWVLRLYNLLSDRQVALTAPIHVAPVIAALYACAEAIDRRGDLEPAPPLLERIAGLAAEVHRAPERALALVCVARFAARRQDADLARKRFADALQTITDAHEHGTVPCLHLPASLEPVSWVALDAMRGLAGLEPIEETLARFDRLPTARQPIVENRLAALRLSLTGAIRVPDVIDDGRMRAGASPADADLAIPATVAQLAVLPKGVVQARDLVEIGRPAQGVRQLGELASIVASERHAALASAVEGAYVEAVTRMRLGEVGYLSRQLASATLALSLTERERMRAFLPAPLAEPSPEEAPTRADRHAIWRARRAFDEASRLALARWGVRFLTAPITAEGQGEWASASVALDLVECSDLGAEEELASHGLTPASPEDWWNRHPALPEYALRLWIRSAALGVSPGGPTSALVRRVGVRRAAAIAMEEGEMLALRLPGQALQLLALALTWYEDAHDLLGVWQVTALLTLTRVRAGGSRESVDLGALRAAHEALVAQRSAPNGPDGLMSWSALSTVTLPLSAPPAVAQWVPWLHRLIALQQWNSGGVRPEVLFGHASTLAVELRDWPSGSAKGVVTTTQSAVAPPPAEAQVQPAPGPSSQPMARAPAPPRATGPTAPSTSLPTVLGPSRTPSRRLAVGLALGVVTLVVAAVLAGLPVWATALVVLLAVLAVVFAWYRYGQAAAPHVVPTWTARITPTGGAAGATRLAALDVSAVLFDAAGAAVATVPIRIRRTDAFAGLDALRQPPAGTALSAPLPESPPLMRAWIDLTLATAWPCWEALLWSGRVELDGRLLLPAVVRRMRAVRAPAPFPPVGLAWAAATIAASSTEERQAMYAWEPAIRGEHVRVRAVPAEVVRQGLPQPDIALVHVVARPVETPYGLFFEVSGGERALVDETIVSLGVNRGTLFDASHLANTFPAASVALIQPPRRPSLDVSPTSRETSAQLRIIGAGLAEQGVGLVVVLPPLDGELGAEVIRLLGRRLAGARVGRPIDPHEYTTRARELVFTLAQRLLPRDPAIELALQVTVYVSQAS